VFRRGYARVVVLFALSPLIGEVLFGAVPLSLLPFGLLGLVGLYGGGALLVREIVRGRHLPACWLVLLGLAYGIFEEGPIVQSLFDPHFRGLDFLGSYGHWFGVNWVWALFIVPYHAVFSVAIPILLTELIVDDRQERWLTTPGLVVTALVFAVNAVFLAVKHTGLFTAHAPVTSVSANAWALVIVGAIVVAAFLASPEKTRDGAALCSRPTRRLRLLALGCGLAWFVGFRVLIIGTGTLMTAPLALLSGSAIAVAVIAAIWFAASPASRRSSEEIYALVAGALPASWLLGFVIAAVSGGNPAVNLAGQVAFGAVMFTGLRRLHLRIRARSFAPVLQR
jgi:hypothetical protein